MGIDAIDPAIRIMMLANAIGDCANAIRLGKDAAAQDYLRQVEWNIVSLKVDCANYFEKLMAKQVPIPDRH